MKIDSRFPFRNGSRLKDLPPVLLCVVHGASGSSSAPAPNACRQPAGGHPGSTQRVQRLRRYSVAGIGRRDGVAARASGFCGRAASPLWDCLYMAGQAALGQCCRAPGIVGPVARRCYGDRMLQWYCLFSLPGQKKERGGRVFIT